MDVNALSQWLNHQVLAAKPQAKVEPPPAAKSKPQASLPKPKFEFYTLLTKDQQAVAARDKEAANHKADSSTQVAAQTAAEAVNHAKPVVKIEKEPVKVAEGKPLKPVIADRHAYLIQVASFKARHDAERVKAALTLKGYEVNIAALNQAQGNWYRVILGPYAGKATAEKALSNLARNEHIKGMLRKQA